MKILYIDGGGTKTAGYLVDNNIIIDKFQSGASNLNNDFELAVKNITLILSYFKNKFDEVIMGLAGIKVDQKRENNLVESFKKFTNKNVILYSDLELISILAIKPKNEPGLLINFGTGTAVIHYDTKTYRTILGWGKHIGDIGSGYDIGISFIQYLAWCDDTQNKPQIYLDFLKDFKIESFRDYTKHTYEIANVTGLAKWLANHSEQAIKDFIIPRVKAGFDYIKFIDVNNMFFSGSILTKNKIVQEFVKEYYKGKKIKFVDFESCFGSKGV